MNINFASKLKNTIIVLILLVTVNSNCFAGEDVTVSYQENKVLEEKRMIKIEFYQELLIQEIKKNKYKYKHLYKYLMRGEGGTEIGLCEALADYIAYRRLLNEENADQLSNTEVVLSDLNTILGIVERIKKRPQYSKYPAKEQNNVCDKFAAYFNKFYQEVKNEKYQLAEEAFKRGEMVLKNFWREMYMKNQIVNGFGFYIQGVVISPYNMFTLEDILSFVVNKSLKSGIINEQRFMNRIREVEVGTYIKFYAMDVMDGDEGNGHAMLIAKNENNNFAFFDPNHGMIFNLTPKSLFEIVNSISIGCNEIYSNLMLSFINHTKAVEGAKNKFGNTIASYFLPYNFYLS